MSSSYSEIPKRLLEYRKALNKNQEEMCKMFAVVQNHYSKLENGLKIISYRSLKEFEKNGGDVCYLITGSPHYNGITDEYIRERKTTFGKIQTIHMILWLVKQGLALCGQNMDAENEIKKQIYLLELDHETSVWEGIREAEGITQEKMAARLDINIKRYRDIEKLKIEPDADILYSLYVEFGYSPMIIINRDKYSISELNKIWDGFPDEIKNILKKLLDDTMQLIELCEKCVK